jgi:magnesium-transporting ATPase (P-type)
LLNVRQRTEHSKASADTEFTAKTSPVQPEEDKIMLYTIAVVLIILWLLGLVTSYTVGGFIHILLVVAVIMILVRLISGRGI